MIKKKKLIDSRNEMLAAFAARLAKLMNEHNTTRKELAYTIGISNPTLGMYLKGQYLPKADVAYLIAQFFGVSIEYLLGITSK